VWSAQACLRFIRQSLLCRDAEQAPQKKAAASRRSPKQVRRFDMDELKGRALNLKTLVNYSDGAVVSRTLLKKETGNITLFSFDKGQGLSEHTSPFDAVVEVVEGEGTFIIAGEPKTVKAGEMIIMPANVPHDVQAAEAPFKMLLIMIRSPS
jgi:quercetin dioxygenase-like cupin family protein